MMGFVSFSRSYMNWISYVASEMKWQPVPSPWQSHTAIIATLIAIGYAKDSDLLLAISETGRGIFNCLTGEKVARDRNTNESEWHDKKHLVGLGIGPLDKQEIRLAGDGGGGLKTSTSDGWRLEVISPFWPLSSIVLCPSFGSVIDSEDTEAGVKIFPKDNGDSILAYGFSDTEKSFVIATRGHIIMFSRP